MIIEFVGCSGVGKSSITQVLSKTNNNFIDIELFFRNKHKLLKFLFFLNILFNFRILYALFILRNVLIHRKVKNKRIFYIHFLYHCVLTKLAVKFSKKGYYVILSENFLTMIPNAFANNYDRKQQKFLKLIKKFNYRDKVIYIKATSVKTYGLYKSKRDESIISDCILNYNKQTKLFDFYLKKQNYLKKCLLIKYDYTELSLKKCIQEILCFLFKR